MFNLVDDPWLPVILKDEQSKRLSLRDALLKSSAVLRLDVPIETIVPAILRQVMLPVLMRSIGLPKDERTWARWFESGAGNRDFAAQVSAYLDAQRSAFELFDSERPFAQFGVGSLPESDGPSGLGKLVATRASGNNVPLFTAEIGSRAERMPPHEAVLWLLHTHCWDYGGPKPKPSQGVGVGPLGRFGVVIPEGQNLFETLLLNLPIVRGGLAPGDLPHWELRSKRYAGRTEIDPSPDSLVGMLAQQARSIRLAPDDPADPREAVGALVYPGTEYNSVPDHEPHAIWRWQGSMHQGRNVPGRHPYDHGTWWGLQSLLALPDHTTPEHEHGRARLARQLDMVGRLVVKGYLAPTFQLRIGIYGARYSSPPGRCEGIVHDRIPVPVAALIQEDKRPERSAVTESSVQIRDLARTLDIAWTHLRKAAGYREGNGGRNQPAQKGLDPTDLLLDRVDPLARRLFSELQGTDCDYESVDAAMRRWEHGLRRAVQEVFEQLLAIVGRRAVAGRTVAEKHGDRVIQVEYNAIRAEHTVWAQIRKSLSRLGSEMKEPTNA